MNKNWVYKFVLTIVVISGMFMASCSKGGSGYGTTTNPPSNSGTSVSIVNMSFSPANLTVSVGSTVKWTNNDGMAHTVTSDNGSFDSGNMAGGATYSKMFSTVGTFPYHCTIHPGMTGKITVTAN
jgi:plastocyanin